MAYDQVKLESHEYIRLRTKIAQLPCYFSFEMFQGLTLALILRRRTVSRLGVQLPEVNSKTLYKGYSFLRYSNKPV